MRLFLRKYIIIIVVVIVILIGGVTYFSQRHNTPTLTTDTVTTGTVSQLISISGTVDAVGTAELTLPITGTVQSISVKEGDLVKKGDLLLTISHSDLRADAQDAYASLLITKADRDELINGLRNEARDISKTELEIAQEDLVRVTEEQDEIVNNLYRALLSKNIEAKFAKREETAPAPRVSGAFWCEAGTYTIDVYKSNARSGYSYRLSGIEQGTYSVFTDAPSPIGTCGLSLQFSENTSYSNTSWKIVIPNTESSTYITDLNAYNEALTAREHITREAEQALILAEQNNTLDLATPRDEAQSRENARVLQSEARLASINAKIQDRILRAPFDGVITNIEPVVGETIGTIPVVTMVSEEAFALTALIPEIDITKVTVGQKADVLFDARLTEELSAPR